MAQLSRRVGSLDMQSVSHVVAAAWAKRNWVMSLIACILLALIARRALTTLDFNWDSLAYHLPFAARLSGIFSESEFLFIPHIENRYLGLPVFGNFLQGAAWRLFNNPAAANIVSWGGLVAFIGLAAYRLKLQFWHLTLFVLSIPLVLIHATTSYMDLLPNALIGLSLISLLYAYENDDFSVKGYIFILFPLMLANNVKIQAVFIALFIVLCTVLLFIWKRRDALFIAQRPTATLGRFILVSVILFSLGSVTYVDNLIREKNPFYPVATDIGPFAFDGPENSVGSKLNTLPPELREISASERFLLSVSEQYLWTENERYLWEISGAQVSDRESPAFKTGGFFVANLILWGAVLLLVNLKYRDQKILVYSILLVAAFAYVSVLPFSHFLRYWMFLPMLAVLVVLLARRRLYHKNPDVFRLVVLIQIALFAFVFHHNQRYLDPISRDNVVRSYVFEEEVPSPVCIVGGTSNYRFGLLVKIANPEHDMQIVRWEEQCIYEAHYPIGF